MTRVLFGFESSSTGPTVFGEAYWNGGWPLVIVTGFASGVIIFAIGWTCLWLLQQGTILAWPMVFLGMLSGHLLTNFFTSGLVGTAVVFFLLTITLRIFLSSKKRKLKPYSYGSRIDVQHKNKDR